MLVRLRDFAELHRISERTVQVHIKNNEEELAGHIDRRGKQGTWLDEFAVNFLLDRIQLPTKDEVLMPTAREAVLLEQVAAANRRLADAERRAADNAEAAGKVFFLEAAQKAQEAQISALNVEVGKQTQKAEQATEKAEKALKTAEAWKKYAADLEVYNSLGWFKRRKADRPVAPMIQEE